MRLQPAPCSTARACGARISADFLTHHSCLDLTALSRVRTPGRATAMATQSACWLHPLGQSLAGAEQASKQRAVCICIWAPAWCYLDQWESLHPLPCPAAEFFVSEIDKSGSYTRVLDPRKLAVIQKVRRRAAP